MNIKHKFDSSNERPYIIAEAGTNFRGDIKLAKAFIKQAAAAGADAIKFQTHVPSAEMVESEMRDIGHGGLFDRMSEYALSVADHESLADMCKNRNIDIISTPFSVEGVEILESVDISVYKIGSGELTNHHLLARVAETETPVIVSTGMHEMKDIMTTHELLKQKNCDHIFLYCVSEYPTAPETFELGVINKMKSKFGVPIGLSDHSVGIKVATIAMSRGAAVVEKHFTIDRRLPGGDQEVSIEPKQLAELVKYADLTTATQGNKKHVTEDEADIAHWARHSIVTSTEITEGTELTSEHITTKRPGTGIPASEYFDIIGKKLTRDVQPDEILHRPDVK